MENAMGTGSQLDLQRSGDRQRLRLILRKARRFCFLILASGISGASLFWYNFDRQSKSPALSVGRNRMIRLQCSTTEASAFEVLGEAGTAKGTNVRNAIALIANMDYYYYIAVCLLVTGSTLFFRSYDIMGERLSKFIVWLACVLYICICVSCWVTQEILKMGSPSEVKQTQLVLLNTASSCAWIAIYTIAIVQAWGYGVYFKPPASSNNEQQEKTDVQVETKPQDKAKTKQNKSWWKRPEWRKWWAFCRSLGHRDMTIPTLYGAGSVIGYGTLVMKSEDAPNAIQNKSLAIEMSVLMIEVGWLLTTVHAGWFLQDGYRSRIEALDAIAKEARNKANESEVAQEGSHKKGAESKKEK